MTYKQRSNTIAGIRTGLLLITALVFTSSATKAASILVNGSFEQGPAAGSFVNLPGGTTSITGWVVTGEGIDYIGTLWTSSNGIHSLDLDGSVGSTITPPFVHGGIAQTFATSPGTAYLVTFDMAGNPANAPTIKPMRVSAAGQQMDFTFDITGKSFANMGWLPKSWSFTANSASTTLTFSSLTISPLTGWGPALDNVSVTAAASAVPEPSTFVLLGAALAGIGARRWRKSRLTK